MAKHIRIGLDSASTYHQANPLFLAVTPSLPIGCPWQVVGPSWGFRFSPCLEIQGVFDVPYCMWVYRSVCFMWEYKSL
jgi:hypothetical protein